VSELKPMKNIWSSFVPDTFETVRDVNKALSPPLRYGYRKDFFQGGLLGGQWCPEPHLKYVPLISCLAPGCCIHPILYLKNVPSLWFLAPLQRNPGDGSNLTVPTLNATERLFSCLRQLKNYLTNKLNQAHLNHKMFLHIHKQLIDQVDLVAILQKFIAENDRRIKLFWKEFCTVAP